MDQNTFTVLPFPRSRQVVVDAGRLGARRPIIFALLELDVTNARAIMRQYKTETGESFSFTAFIVACLGRAIAAEPGVQAYKNWRNQLIVYDDVDLPIGLLVAREIRMVGSFRFHEEFGFAANLIASGRVDLKPLITDVVPFAEAVRAFEIANDRSRAMKVQLSFT